MTSYRQWFILFNLHNLSFKFKLRQIHTLSSIYLSSWVESIQELCLLFDFVHITADEKEKRLTQFPQHKEKFVLLLRYYDEVKKISVSESIRNEKTHFASTQHAWEKFVMRVSVFLLPPFCGKLISAVDFCCGNSLDLLVIKTAMQVQLHENLAVKCDFDGSEVEW